MSIGSIFQDIEKAGMKVGQFFATAIKLGSAIKQMWGQCGAQTLTVASQVFYDVVKTASLATGAATDASANQWSGAVQLSEQTISSVSQLVADAKAGEQQIVADFKALQYDFMHQ
jgi:hypothetical protein